MTVGESIDISGQAQAQVRGAFLNSPRELSGGILWALEETLSEFEGEDSFSFVDSWYRSAGVATYASHEAAAAYLGAYGPRSILKYQEAVLALLLMRRRVRRHTRVVDYGAGPCVGYAALVDLWDVLGRSTGEILSLEYVAVDRSEFMMRVGLGLCRRVAERAKTSASFDLIHMPSFASTTAHMLIVANVMNDGEGNTDCRHFMLPLVPAIQDLEDIIVIEPATEQPSRQMCGLGAALGPFQHIGPCPSGEAHCTEWSFCQFTKRVYACERRCLGQWVSAARKCKYSLALLSKLCGSRQLPKDGRVVVGQRSASGCALTCRFGQEQVMRIGTGGSPWDVVDLTGNIQRWWPQ